MIIQALIDFMTFLGEQYFKEYTETDKVPGDELCASRTVTDLGKRVLVIDDLVATGVSWKKLTDMHTFLYNLYFVY